MNSDCPELVCHPQAPIISSARCPKPALRAKTCLAGFRCLLSIVFHYPDSPVAWERERVVARCRLANRPLQQWRSPMNTTLIYLVAGLMLVMAGAYVWIKRTKK